VCVCERERERERERDRRVASPKVLEFITHRGASTSHEVLTSLSKDSRL
jgi:hypothetical protein